MAAAVINTGGGGNIARSVAVVGESIILERQRSAGGQIQRRIGVVAERRIVNQDVGRQVDIYGAAASGGIDA